MDRTDKEAVVASLRKVFSEANLVVVTHQTGLNVTEATDLRRKMREVGATYKVTKNRLTKRALDGSPFAEIADLFVGPTAIAYSEDPVAAARVAVDFAKANDKLIVVGGAMPDQLLDEARVKQLASLPSLDELRAQIIALLNTPATQIASIMQAPAGQLARVIGAYSLSEGPVDVSEPDVKEPAAAEMAAEPAVESEEAIDTEASEIAAPVADATSAEPETNAVPEAEAEATDEET